MLVLSVSFDLGRVHATPWGTHVNEALVEWPPSPWRLLRALLAASYAHADLSAERPSLRDALRTLANAPDPQFLIPETSPAHTRHYLPLATWSPTASGETRLVIDAFLAVDPAADLQVGWQAELPSREHAALTRAAAAIGYLGRSESVCTIRVTDEMRGAPNVVPASYAPAWAADARSAELWNVSPDSIDSLELSVTDLRKRRLPRPTGVRSVPYLIRAPAEVAARQPAPQSTPTLACLRVRGGARPPLTDAILVGLTLRAALQRRCSQLTDGAASSVFSGHDDAGNPRRDQHQHAHYLTGSDPGQRRADHLWIWAPGGLGADELAAIAALRELRFRDSPEPCRVGLVALGDHREMRIPGLTEPSSSWRSATPFVLVRHQKRRSGRMVDTPEAQITRELALRGMPEPLEIELSRRSWSGFQLTRPGVARRRASPAVGATLRFAAPLSGPIAIGAHSHFGLGRFEPML